MGRLPPESDQVWLLNELARLVAVGSDRQLVRSPIRRPSPDDFPDPWTGDVTSLQRLCRRLMRYAGIGKLDVWVESFDIDEAAAGPGCGCDGAAAWFAGITDGMVRFGCVVRRLAEGGEQRVGGMAHEVARAWRAIHGVVERDGDREELLTGLTTVYLGFGVFALNDGSRSRGRQGRGLPPEHLAFAFAAQILARRTSCFDTWRLLRLLEPIPRADTRAALRRLRPADDVRRRLGLTLLDDPPAIDFLRADDRPPVD